MPKISKMKMINTSDSSLNKLISESFFLIKQNEYSPELLKDIKDDLLLLELLNDSSSEFLFDVVLDDEESAGGSRIKYPILLTNLFNWIILKNKETNCFKLKNNIKNIKMTVFKQEQLVNFPSSMENLMIARRAIMVLKTSTFEGGVEDLIDKTTSSTTKGVSEKHQRYEARDVFSFKPVVPMLPSFTKLVTENAMLVSRNDLIKGYDIRTDLEKRSVVSPPVYHMGRLTSNIIKNPSQRIIIICDFISSSPPQIPQGFMS